MDRIETDHFNDWNHGRYAVYKGSIVLLNLLTLFSLEFCFSPLTLALFVGEEQRRLFTSSSGSFCDLDTDLWHLSPS